MSWFKFAETTSKSADHPTFSAAAREAKRAKLETDRFLRIEARKQFYFEFKRQGRR